SCSLTTQPRVWLPKPWATVLTERSAFYFDPYAAGSAPGRRSRPCCGAYPSVRPFISAKASSRRSCANWKLSRKTSETRYDYGLSSLQGPHGALDGTVQHRSQGLPHRLG